MATQIQIRRDSAADWTSNDPTLAEGEIGYETDTGYFKIGDGATAWTSLGYTVTEMPMYTVRMVNDETAGYDGTLGSGGADWEYPDSTLQSNINSPALASIESNGVFSFPSLGKWNIRAYGTGTSTGAETLILYIRASDDNFTSYSAIASGLLTMAASGELYSCSLETTVEITSLSNDKIQLYQSSSGAASYFKGDSNSNRTYIVFEKKCD